MTRRLRLLVRTAAAVSTVVALSLVSVLPAGAAPSYVAISGSGSTWSQNALDQWRRNVANNFAMTVNYSGTGSSAGRSDFISGRVDFAVSEIPFQLTPDNPNDAPEDPSGRPYAYLPIVAGGSSFMYNLKINGKRVTTLQLTGEVISKIFTGAITAWNDPAIQSLNPDLALPSRPITPVVRSDGSGSTAQFTRWMATQYPSIWTYRMTSQFPTINSTFKAQNGSLGVSGYVKQDYGEGAITYVEYSYALNAGFPVVRVQNAAGAFVEPTAANVQVALTHAKINTDQSSPDYLTQILDDVYNAPEADAYPVSSYSYMIVPTAVGGVFTDVKGFTLGEFLKYVVCEGQNQAATLGYSPLPMNLVQAAYDQIKRIPGASVSGFDPSTCKNSGAPANDPGSGASGGSGDGSGGGGAAAAAGGTAAAAGAAASDPVYDANGNLVSGAAAGGAQAVSSPFTLASDAWGVPQTTMLVAGGLLVAAVILPPLLSRRLRNDRRR